MNICRLILQTTCVAFKIRWRCCLQSCFFDHTWLLFCTSGAWCRLLPWQFDLLSYLV
uniref:Uncharacterized protein n=1 Tax=Arundo donax TaxID=35708 RepID=A0A0A9SCG8_ARUDO